MTEPEVQTATGTNEPVRTAGSVRNLGEPLRFTNVEPLVGFLAESAKGGQTAKVWTRLFITSDEPLFHRIVENLANVISHMAQRASIAVDLRRANTMLLILKPDNSAEIWHNTIAIAHRCALKRPVSAGTVVFEHDIADITGIIFPCVTFEEGDKVLFLFREDWRFGFACDMNPEGKFDIESFTTALGTLCRDMRYRHLYEAIANQAIFDQLVATGWFPFVEIITAEFKEILQHCEAGSDMADIEDRIITKFDESRLQHIFERWIAKPHFAARSDMLKEALDAFTQKKQHSVIKILLTEIEGILNDAFRAEHGGQGAKTKDLLTFAIASAEERAGGSNTLFFPIAFGRYLKDYTFANFDPVAQTGTAGSRHAVGHGAAAQESYTMARALQAILTLDQIAFYT